MEPGLAGEVHLRVEQVRGVGTRGVRDVERTPARSIAKVEFHHTTDEINEVARRIVAALEAG